MHSLFSHWLLFFVYRFLDFECVDLPLFISILRIFALKSKQSVAIGRAMQCIYSTFGTVNVC